MNRPGQPEQAETFGLPDSTPILAAKLRNMDPELLAAIRGKGKP